MPPRDNTPESINRYLTRILAALAKGNGGELRIKRRLLRQVEDETSRQVLLEDLDTKHDEIVLRFGSKHSAIYPVEAESFQPRPQPQPQPQAAPPATPSNSVSPRPGVANLPFTDDQLARAERKIRQIRTAAALRRNPPSPQL